MKGSERTTRVDADLVHQHEKWQQKHNRNEVPHTFCTSTSMFKSFRAGTSSSRNLRHSKAKGSVLAASENKANVAI